MSNYSDKAIELFHALLRSVISTGEKVDLQGTEELAGEVLSLAKAQGVLLLICCSIEKNNGELSIEYKNNRAQAIYQYIQNEHTLKKAKEILNEGEIRFVPLKGAVIKELYSEPWMRQSCDIDILIQEKDIEKAIALLVEAGFTTDNKREYHDVSLYYGPTHLELHFNICENIPRIDNTLSQVWKHIEPVDGYEYCETNEFFAFHILAHMLYHFLRGGSNIKQFVDFYLLRKNNIYDEEKLKQLLSGCKLEKFYKVICEFTDSIMTGKETDLTQKIEKMVLSGGLILRSKQSDNVSIAVGGGIGKYILKSVFLPKREMEWIYPILKKHPILLPHFYNKRLLTKTIGKERERAQNVLKAHKNPDNDTEKLLKELGLS